MSTFAYRPIAGRSIEVRYRDASGVEVVCRYQSMPGSGAYWVYWLPRHLTERLDVVQKSEFTDEMELRRLIEVTYLVTR